MPSPPPARPGLWPTTRPATGSCSSTCRAARARPRPGSGAAGRGPERPEDAVNECPSTRIIRAMPVTRADFGLHGRIDNYRARLTDLLEELDRMVREEIDDVNRSRLGGKGEIRYETLPPRWTLAWRGGKHPHEANPMAFAPGGARGVHGREGFGRPF